MNSPKKFFLDQHGCAKNQVDGELMLTRLLNKGLVQTFEPEEADIIIVNSCGFIETAKKESLNAVCHAKENYPDAKIILSGCLAERYADIFKENLPEADAVFGNGNISELDKLVDQLENGDRPVITFRQEGVCSGDRKVLLGYRGSAFVKITEGCSNHCSFCAIPLIRGELRSRPYGEIISEIKNLVSSGVKEINLIGQDLAAYGTGTGDNVFGTGRLPFPVFSEDGKNLGTEEKSGLARLLEKISEISGNFVVRLLYIHPDHFNYDIFPVIKKDSRILSYFDIPFQSGDDEIILKMNRRGSFAIYKNLVNEIRFNLPDAVLRTTFLTGFPGETDENSANTLKFLSEIESDWSGCFPYSREEDTPAYSYKNRVSSKTAQKRADELEKLQAEITLRKLSDKVGKEFNVLVEEVVDGEEGLAICRAWFQAPEVDGNVVVRYDRDDESQVSAVKAGSVLKVKILAVSGVDLDAVFISEEKKYSDNKDSELKFAPELI